MHGYMPAGYTPAYWLPVLPTAGISIPTVAKVQTALLGNRSLSFVIASVCAGGSVVEAASASPRVAAASHSERSAAHSVRSQSEVIGGASVGAPEQTVV